MRKENWWNDTDSGKQKYWQKIMCQRHIIHHTSHINFSVIEEFGKSNGLIYYVAFNTFLKRQKGLLLLDGRLQHTSARR
jgi:hypothetical protein